MDTLYAEALVSEARKDGAKANVLVKNLTRHLADTGRSKLLPGILRELQRLSAREEKLMPTIEVAHKSLEAAAVKGAAAHGIETENVRVNPDLIQGWRASGNGKLIDHSGKRALIDLYQKITN